MMSSEAMEEDFAAVIDPNETMEVAPKNLLEDFSVSEEPVTLTAPSLGQERMRVYLRVRPFTESEINAGEKQNCIDVEDSRVLVTHAPSSSHTFKNCSYGHGQGKMERTHHRFTFSRIFDENTTQKAFFDDTVLGTVKEFIDGQNCLLFTYGVTNSGKTYTVQGNPKEAGILPRALDVIFNSVGNRQLSRASLKPHMFSDVLKINSALMAENEKVKESVLKLADHDEPDMTSMIGSDVSHITTNSTMSDDSLMVRESVTSVDSLSCDVQEILHETESRDREEAAIDIEMQGQIKVLIYVSFAEIYNEQVFDLLEPLPKKKNARRHVLQLREDKNGTPYVKGLNEIHVSSADEAYKVLTVGKRNLQMACTKLNHNSSRSHCIFMIKLIKVVDKEDPHLARTSMLSFCDLAGSERYTKTQSMGERIKEAGNINTSLLTLGRCITILRHNQMNKDHPQIVPFRESKLTRLFQSFFSGKGRASMIVNVNQNASTFDETLHALKYSAVAKQVIVEHEAEKPPPAKVSRSNSKRFMSQSFGKANQRQTIAWATPGSYAKIMEEEEKACNLPLPGVNEDSDLEDDDDERIQELEKKVSQLRKQLVEEKVKNTKMEVSIREEVCQEMALQMVRLETAHSESLERERANAEDLVDYKVDLLTQSLRINRKRKRVIEDEADDEMVHSVLLHAEQHKVQERDAEISKMTAEISDLKKTIADLQSRLDSAAERAQPANHDVSSNEDHAIKMADLIAKLADSESEVDRAQKQVTKLQQVIDLLQCEVSDRDDRISALSSASQEDDALKQRCDNLQEKLATRDQALQSAEQMLTESSKVIAEAERIALEKDERIEELCAQLDKPQGEESKECEERLKKRCRDQQEQLDDYIFKVNEQAIEIGELQEELEAEKKKGRGGEEDEKKNAEMEEKMKELMERKDKEMQKRLEEMKKEADHLLEEKESALKEAQQSVSKLEDVVKDFEMLLKSAKTGEEKAVQAAEEARKKCRKLEDRLESQEQSLATLQEQYDMLQSQASTGVDKSEERLAAMQATVDRCNCEVKELEAELDVKQTEVECLEKEAELERQKLKEVKQRSEKEMQALRDDHREQMEAVRKDEEEAVKQKARVEEMLAQSQAALEETELKIAGVTNQCEMAQADCVQMKEQLETFKTQLQSCQMDTAREIEKSGELQEKLKAREAEYDRVVREMRMNLEKEAVLLKEEMSSQGEMLREAQSEKGELEKKCCELSADLEGLKDSSEREKEELLAQCQEREDAAKARLEEEVKRVQALEASKDELSSRLKDAALERQEESRVKVECVQQAMNDQAAAHQLQLSKLQEEIAAKDMSIDSYSRQISLHQEEVALQSKQMERSKERESELRKKLAEKAIALDKQNDTITQLETKLEDLENQSQNLGDMEHNLQTLKDDLQSAKQEVGEKSKEVDDLRAKLSTVEKKVENLEQDCEKKEAKIRSRQKTISELMKSREEEHAAFEIKLKDAKSNEMMLNNLKMIVTDHEGIMQTQDEVLKRREENIKELEQDLEEQSSKLIKSRNEVDQIQAEYDALKATVATFKQEGSMLEAKMGDMGGEKRQLLLKIQDLEDEKLNLSEELRGAKREVSQMERERTRLQADARETNEELRDLEKQMADKSRQLKELQDEALKTSASVKKESQTQLLKGKFQVLEDSKKQLEQEVSRLNEQLSLAESRKAQELQKWREERDKLVSGLEQILAAKDQELTAIKEAMEQVKNTPQTPSGSRLAENYKKQLAEKDQLIADLSQHLDKANRKKSRKGTATDSDARDSAELQALQSEIDAMKVAHLEELSKVTQGKDQIICEMRQQNQQLQSCLSSSSEVKEEEPKRRGRACKRKTEDYEEGSMLSEPEVKGRKGRKSSRTSRAKHQGKLDENEDPLCAIKEEDVINLSVMPSSPVLNESNMQEESRVASFLSPSASPATPIKQSKKTASSARKKRHLRNEAQQLLTECDASSVQAIPEVTESPHEIVGRKLRSRTSRKR